MEEANKILGFDFIDNDKKRLLFIKHEEGGIGGVGTFVFSLVHGLKEFNSIIVYPYKKNLITEFFIGGVFKIRYFFTTSENYTKEQIILDLIDFFRIELVNVNHLYGFDLELINKLKLKNIPLVLNLHDLFLATGSIDYMQSGLVSYLSGEENQKMVKILDAFSLKIFPSEFLQKEFKKVFKFNNEKVIPIGIKIEKSKNTFEKSNKLTLGYIGVASRQKGLETFFKLIQTFGKKINFVVLGAIGQDYEKLCKLYNVKEWRDFIRYDWNDENIKQIIKQNKLDVLIFPSQIPESYSLTLSIAIQMSIPVIAFDFGAIGERVREFKAGWVYKNDEELVKIIENILNNKSCLVPYIENLNEKEIPNFIDTADNYKKIFQSFIQENSPQKIMLSGKDKTFMGFLLSSKSTIEERINFDTLHKENVPLSLRIKKAVRSLPIIGDFLYRFYKKSKVK